MSRRRRAKRGSGVVGNALWIVVAGGFLGLSAFVLNRPEVVAPVVEPELWTEGRVRVEVKNGGGVSGMAWGATKQLRGRGFDVVGYGNAASFDHERASVVIDRVGDLELARAVAEALGIDNVVSEPDANLYVDVSVVLGAEWTAAEPTTTASAGDASWLPNPGLDR